jgi:hypothetical protein
MGLQTCFSCGEAFADTRIHCTGCGRRVPRVDPEAFPWLNTARGVEREKAFVRAMVEGPAGWVERPVTARALGLGDLRAQAGLETLHAAVSAESAFVWTEPPSRGPMRIYREKLPYPIQGFRVLEYAGPDFAAPSTVSTGGAAYGR